MNEQHLWVQLGKNGFGMPDIATVSLESGILRCGFHMFGMEVRRSIEIPVVEIGAVKSVVERGFVRLGIFDKAGKLLFRFEPGNPQAWQTAFRECGMEVPGDFRLSSNQVSQAMFHVFEWVVLAPLFLVLALILFAWTVRFVR